MNDKKIIQITPCERGWHCSYSARDRDGEFMLANGNVIRVRAEVACWALLDDGEVEPMVAADRGGLWRASVWAGSHDFDVYSPNESWDYAVTYVDGRDLEPPYPDWEAVQMCETESLVAVLWRGRE